MDRDGPCRRMAEPADHRSRSFTARDALTVALALGLACGLGEGAGLWFAQQARRTQWAVTFSCGSEVLWVAPLVDGGLFVALGAVALATLRACRRRPAAGAWVAVGVALLTYDWMRITNERSRGVALGGAVVLGLAAGVVAHGRTPVVGHGGIAVTERSRAAAMGRLATIASTVLLAATALVAGVVELGGRWRERHATAGAPAPPAAARDVVIVVLDTVRSDHLSAYGYPRATSPKLAALATEGARFDACFSTSSWTLPAHASLLSGRLCAEHGANLGALDATWPLLPEALAAHGWRTGVFSGNLCYFHTGYGFGRGFHHFDDFGWCWSSRLGAALVGRELLDLVGPLTRSGWLRKPARAVADAFLEWVDRDPERPLFAVLNWFDAHDPYAPPPSTAGRFAGDGLDPPPMTPMTTPTPLASMPPSPAMPVVASVRADDPPNWSDAELARDVQHYDECLLALDGELAHLCDELARRGRLDRTILVVVGDHGESFGERGARRHRGSLHREQMQVPLVIRAPGLVAPATRIDVVTSIASLPATLLDLAGLSESGFPGPSLVPLLRADGSRGGELSGDAKGDEDLGGAAAIAELARHPWPEYRRRPCYTGALRSLVRDRWHYVWHEKTGAELFDWRADPREEHDLAAARPEIVAALANLLQDELATRVLHPDSIDREGLESRPELAGIGYASGQ